MACAYILIGYIRSNSTASPANARTTSGLNYAGLRLLIGIQLPRKASDDLAALPRLRLGDLCSDTGKRVHDIVGTGNPASVVAQLGRHEIRHECVAN